MGGGLKDRPKIRAGPDVRFAYIVIDAAPNIESLLFHIAEE
jgi:hypothetical protein